MNVHLKGYFGYENFGDDLLMISSYNIIKKKYPKSKIYIRSKSQYINKLIPEIKLVDKFEDLPEIDVLIHGGGGVFFDFKKGNSLFYNYIAKFISLNIFNGIINFTRPKSKLKIIGWSLGIGPYSSSSNLFLKEMYHLSKFDFLAVRDNDISYKLAQKVNKKNAFLYTDIVFNHKLWKKYYNITTSPDDSSVTIIPRGWEFKRKEFKELKLAEELTKKGIIVKFLFFNPLKDIECINLLEKTAYKIVLYNAKTANNFLSELKNTKLIISQRAHGAIVGNVLGIPSICIGIEPKLKNVHKMMPLSTKYIELDYRIVDMVDNIEKELKNNTLKKQVLKDLENNQNKIIELQKKLNGV